MARRSKNSNSEIFLSKQDHGREDHHKIVTVSVTPWYRIIRICGYRGRNWLSRPLPWVWPRSIPAAAMGVAPLDPSRCYVIAHVGHAAEEERHAFEVRDFTSNAERTSVFVIGRAYDSPSPAMHPDSR
jgi:hypothetical protein